MEKSQIRHGHLTTPPSVLYCVAKPLSDCEINVSEVTAPGELPMHTVNCQVISVHPLNHDISLVQLRLPAGQRIRWHAGQYLMLNIDGDSYPFSIANACTDRDLTLHIRHDDANSAAIGIMALLSTAATVSVTLPGGDRYIDRLPDRPVWFICGSTGFAPVKAMIEHLQQHGFALPVRLFWGARQHPDIYMPDLPAHWQQSLKDFSAVTALSENHHPDHAQGLIHELALAELDQPTEPLFYLGGSPAMAWAVFDALVAAGVPAHHIHSDVFDYAPRT